MNTNNPTLLFVAPAVSVYRVFRNLGLRHIFILDHHSRVVGLVTRKDLVHTTLERLWHEHDDSSTAKTGTYNDVSAVSDFTSQTYSSAILKEQISSSVQTVGSPRKFDGGRRAGSSLSRTDSRPLPHPNETGHEISVLLPPSEVATPPNE
jgi:hypothetical protein